MKHRRLLALALVLPSIVVAWYVLRGVVGKQAPDLPPASSLGAVFVEEPLEAEGDAIYDVLDGGAERLIKAGLSRCVTASYRFPSGTVVAVTLYEFSGSGGPKVVGPETREENYALIIRGRWALELVVTAGGGNVAKGALERIERAWMKTHGR